MEQETEMLIDELIVLGEEYDRLRLKPPIGWWQAEELHQLYSEISRLYMILSYSIEVYRAINRRRQ
jgi:hypothetical protein